MDVFPPHPPLHCHRCAEWSEVKQPAPIKWNWKWKFCYLIHLGAFIVSSRGKLLELFHGQWMGDWFVHMVTAPRLILQKIWGCFLVQNRTITPGSRNSFTCKIKPICLRSDGCTSLSFRGFLIISVVLKNKLLIRDYLFPAFFMGKERVFVRFSHF